MRYLFLFLFSFILLVISAKPSFAQSEYVLPYPSTMPGNALYTVHVAIENLQKYWYFGNLSQFTYNLKQSDKYLVEAKTLFEYKQYLLATKALEKSNDYFQKTHSFLVKAKSEGKDISQKQLLLKSASIKHTEVLQSLLSLVPLEFFWQPEKEPSQKLHLKTIIEDAITIRSIN